MFQFPGFALNPYEFRAQYLHGQSVVQRRAHANARVVTIRIVEGGFPHSEILGSKLVRSSPKLIAAYHVLHRLSAPRHPPNALKTLNHSHDRCPRPAPKLGAGARHHQKDHFRPAFSDRASCRTCPNNGVVKRRPCSPGLQGEALAIGHVPSSRFHRSRPPRENARQAANPLTLDIRRCGARSLVEPDGIEPTTSCLQSTRSPN